MEKSNVEFGIKEYIDNVEYNIYVEHLIGEEYYHKAIERSSG